MKYALLSFFLFLSVSAFSQVGPKYAIEEFSKSKGLKVNPKALKRMGAETKIINNWPITVNEEAIVFIKDQTYVYLARGDYFYLTEVKVRKMSAIIWEISGAGVKSGDVLLSKKAELLHLGQIMNKADE